MKYHQDIVDGFEMRLLGGATWWYKIGVQIVAIWCEKIHLRTCGL